MTLEAIGRRNEIGTFLRTASGRIFQRRSAQNARAAGRLLRDLGYRGGARHERRPHSDIDHSDFMAAKRLQADSEDCVSAAASARHHLTARGVSLTISTLRAHSKASCALLFALMYQELNYSLASLVWSPY